MYYIIVNNKGMINMRKKNGFTLIELLAVIVILAILVLIAMPKVLQTVENARRDTFKVEIQNILNKIESVSTDKILNGGFKTITQDVDGKKIPVRYACMTLQELYKEGFLSKNFDNAGYAGIVEMFIPSVGDVVYGINISNGSYSYRIATPEKLAKDNAINEMGSETGSESNFPKTCKNEPTYTYSQYIKDGFTP